VLSSIDRRTAIGKRNYAVIIVQVTYGLRGTEVVQLKLDDINWRKNAIYIRSRKSGNSCVYPLSISVGEAILSYLRHSRPRNSHRHVFLSHLAPHAPIGSAAIQQILKKALRQTGLDANRVGAHTLRYSCAQHLFEKGFSIKTIGDYLGHRSLSSTQRYVKIDITHLREVAMNDGENLL
jgi:site-specific recombinase XerD